MVELASDAAPQAPVAAVVPATPAIVAEPGATRSIRYWPQQNMVELVDLPAPARAAETSAMGAAAAMGQPVHEPQVDARPLPAQ